MEQTTDTTSSHILQALEEVTRLFTHSSLLNAQITPLGNTPILPASIPQLPAHASTLPESSSATTADLLSHLSTHVLPFLNQSALSANYYGFVTGGCTPAALVADMLTSIYDQNVALHLPLQTIATNVEVAALNMLLDLLRLPRGVWGLPSPGESSAAGRVQGGAGIFTTGATASNIIGLALGREWILNRGTGLSVGENGLVECMHAAGVPFVKILSTMPHSSIAKAASVVGLGRTSVVSIAGDNDPLKINMAKLEAELGKEGGKGRYILAISAGEVNTGRFATDSFRQMRDLRDICNKFGIWMHIDGAFGLYGRVLMESNGNSHSAYHEIVKGVQGIELADSITGDAHKLLNVPYDCGFFLTRHRGLSEKVLSNGTAAYLSSGAVYSDNISSPSNIGIENSRRFRALPVYATLIQYGRAGYKDILKQQIGLARKIAAWLFDHPGFELLPAGQGRDEMLGKTFMVVLFRAKDAFRDLELVKSINAIGKIYVTGTSWDARPAVRIAVSNWQIDIARDSQKIFDVLQRVVSE